MKKILLSIAFSIGMIAFSFAQNPTACLGTWYNQEKDGKILLYKQGDKIEGKIVWLQTPTINGKPRVDDKNEDVSLRNRPVMGLVMVKNLTFSEENLWEGGKIYDPKNGKTYSCKATLRSPKVLELRGFIGISLIGRTATWTKAE
jgi:uncharacterized protein (DUF2147 family)